MPDRRSGADPRPLLRRFLRSAGGELARLSRSGARALIVSGRRWADATKAAAREQLFAASAALEMSDAALAGEGLAELAARLSRLAQGLSGAADVLVFVRSAGRLRLLHPAEGGETFADLAARAHASGRAEASDPGAPASRALALPLEEAGVLVLRAPPGKRLRHRGLAPLLRRAGAAFAAAERQASKVRFLSFAAHELKTPLTTIKGYAFALSQRAGRGEPAEPRAALALERQAERLHSLLEEMLEVSRLETGRFVLHREPCDLRDVLAASLRALRRLGHSADEPDAADDPLPLHADRDRLERALSALALDAAGRGPVRARTGTCGARGFVRIEWQGAPLPEAERRAAFDPRWESTERGRHGLGMALAVAEQVARLHGGALRCEPRAFALELPLREAQASPGEEDLRRVLVVDDDAAIAAMLAAFLGENGFAAEFATAGPAALRRMLEGPPPDLLVLDLRMPDLDGRALLREARERGLRPRTVLLSADREVAQAAVELEADAFVEKPFAPDGLLAAVQGALPARRAPPQPSRAEKGDSS